MLHAALAVATIAKGRLLSLDTALALREPGVRLVLTHEDMEGISSPGFVLGGGYGFQSKQPMIGTDIAYRGQPIALVLADSLEAAIAGSRKIVARYERASSRVLIKDVPEDEIVAQQGSALPQAMFADRRVGDADAAFSAAAVKVDSRSELPAQHQNPLELVATVAEWHGDRLTIYEGTQNSGALKYGVARQLKISPDLVTVISPQAGGGFGQKNSLQMQTVLAAIAARRSGRAVKLVVPRAQIFHDTSFRPASRHRVRLGADSDGRIIAAIHEIDQQTSRHDLFPASYADLTSRLYGFAHFRGRERLVPTDVQTPGYMRAPFEHQATFAFETAIDELAYALGKDPVALRLQNDAKKDPLSGKPFSSRFVKECLERGAKRFDWGRRRAEPGALRRRDGTRVGLGVAIGLYKAATAAAMARLTVTSAGKVSCAVSGHEMGQGLRSAVTAYLAQSLGVAVESITLQVGEPAAVPQHLTAGSWGTATAINAVGEALKALVAALGEGSEAKDFATVLARSGRPHLSVEARSKAPGQPDEVYGRLTTGLPAVVGPVYPDFVSLSSIAHFVEVHVEPGTRRVRVPRVVSIADCGRVLSPTTAASQVSGGVIWAIGGALREISEVDPRFGGFLNADLADYVIPVNADIGDIEVEFIDEPDPKLASGVKGLGEVAMVGAAAAIANAIFNATGRRQRHLPIRLDDMFVA
jgi:xanthine dehydrogenase YagR molybdenum-binding subunit